MIEPSSRRPHGLRRPHRHAPGQRCPCGADTGAVGPLTLADMAPGQSARIVGYEAGNPQYRSRLLAMGLTRGTGLRVLKIAPLGDPIEVEVRGFNLSLRKLEARILLLEPPSA
ncbi:MAG TPA: FeoA family protein [Desulfobacterales bacterium]|nr:FeoA family protein [Desulfobacterales bacterium]